MFSSNKSLPEFQKLIVIQFAQLAKNTMLAAVLFIGSLHRSKSKVHQCSRYLIFRFD